MDSYNFTSASCFQDLSCGKISTSSLFMAKQYSILWLYHDLFNSFHWLIDTWCRWRRRVSQSSTCRNTVTGYDHGHKEKGSWVRGHGVTLEAQGRLLWEKQKQRPKQGQGVDHTNTYGEALEAERTAWCRHPQRRRACSFKAIAKSPVWPE